MGGITHHANGRQQPFSDSTTRGFRGKTVALVDTGVVGTRPVPLGLQHAGWGLVVDDAPLVGRVFCVWDWGWSGWSRRCAVGSGRS